ncbi:YcaO-like family protein [Sedimentibacter sp. zth1]|uniref:YcaO-like family protein n=1 Tax=Sedimentibacter sp. zth1 TaxID=2816908 RepID=UPI001A919EF4|nr:YcaO-like family protein [Sedimentibacter sp. zth1]QSX06290.1 YcaO-like family protein [Sedimentibacter sp. zth1]
MNFIKKRKYKDEYPLNTINKIRNILNDLGILTVESMWKHSANDFFSVTVTVVNTTLSTNGKGTTYEYALASAYGELMERLQNQAPFNLGTNVSQEAIEYKNFFYAPDEKQLSDNDILNSQEEWINKKLAKLNPDIDKKTFLNKWKQMSHEKIPCDFIAVPFYNINSRISSYIPIKMLSKMYMSNGMCAGNTPEEALVQGISEILERNVNMKIITNKLTPPTIPREFIKKHKRVDNLISQIESSGNFEIILKDCSLGQEFPVIGVIFINKDTQSYFVKFGAHPIFELAVERTLTELLQGQDINQMKGTCEFSYRSFISDSHSNLINILVNGCGEYPVEFFSEKESFEFKEPVNTIQMNNKDMLTYLVNLLNKSGHDVYVRDVSFLGFPSFHVIVSDLSEIEEIDDIRQIEDYVQFIKTKKMIRNLHMLTNNEMIELADLIEQANLGFETSIMQYLNTPNCKYSSWYFSNFDLFTTAIYCKIGNYNKAFNKIEKLLISLKLNSCSIQMITYYKCMRDYLAAKADELNDTQIIRKLSVFYQQDMINGIINEIGKPESIFKNHSTINCSNCKFKSNCEYIETEKVYKLLKEKYSFAKIDNKELVNLF